MTPRNTIKKSIQQNKPVFGSFVGLQDPAIVEIAGYAGFDFVIIDSEHWPVDTQGLMSMIRASEIVGITCLVRVPENNPALISRILDFGAHGVVVPRIGSREDATKAVDAAKYPPLGKRSLSSSCRSTKYSKTQLPQHIEESNRETLVVGIIEDQKALDSIDAILATEELDIVFVGPLDLAESIKWSGYKDRSNLLDIVERICRVAKQVGKAKVGFPAFHSVLDLPISSLIDLGINFIPLMPGDSVLLLRAYQELMGKVKQSLAREGTD